MRTLWNVWRCRSNANLFVLSLAMFIALVIVLLIVGTIIREAGLEEYIPLALGGLGLLFAGWGLKAILRERARRRERLQWSPLSSDELRVARSKLMKDRNERSL